MGHPLCCLCQREIKSLGHPPGTYAQTGFGTIYRVGSDYLVTGAGGRIQSFVPNGTQGVGIVNEYYNNGGK